MQSKKDSHSKNRGGKKPNQQSGTDAKKTFRKPNEQLFSQKVATQFFFYLAKLGYAWIISFLLIFVSKHTLWVLVRTASHVLSDFFFSMKFSIFASEKFSVYCMGKFS